MKARLPLLLLSGLLALVGGVAAAADLSLGGELTASSALRLANAGASESGHFRLTPLAVAGGEAWELRLGILAEAGNAPALSHVGLSEARLRLWLGQSLNLEFGYGLDSWGSAEVFPLADFFGPADPLSRFESGGGSLRGLPEAIVRISLSGALGRLSFAYAPLAPSLVLPSLDSPWFPMDRFPEAIEAFGSTLLFAGASYAGLPEARDFDLDPSFEISAGMVAGPFDLGLSYFSGLERASTLFARVYEDAFEYQVELLPLRAEIKSLAASATAILGPIRLWAEAAYTFGSSFATGSYEYGSLPGLYLRQDGDGFGLSPIPPILALDRYAGTLGGGRDFELGALLGRALLEATYVWFPGAPADSSPPELSRAFAYVCSLEGLPGGLGASVSGMVSLQDGSAVLRPGLGLDLGGDRSLEASLPLFFGGPGEDFGRYRQHRFLVLSFSERF